MTNKKNDLPYTLTIGTAGGNGTTTPEAGSYSYATGTYVQIRATPQTDYGFMNWSGNISSDNNSIGIVLDGERARDLQTLPALSQGRTILLRRESAHRFLWDQISYVAPSSRRALHAAMHACGITDCRPSALRNDLHQLLRVQEALHLRHEIGEIHETEFGRGLWQEIIAAFPLTRVELLARRVKDLLADTHPSGTLRWVLRKRSLAGLALHVALADRVTRALFPGLTACLESVLLTGDWAAVSQAADAAHGAAARHAAAISEIFCDGKRRNDLAGVEARIERRLGG